MANQGAGLLGKAMPGQAVGATEPMGHMNPGAAKQPGQAVTSGQEDEPNVSPEEQAAYDQFMNNAYNIIYDETIAPKMLEIIKTAEDPKAALAMAAVNVVMTIQDSAAKDGQTISEDILVHGGVNVIEDIANFANVSGAHTYKPKDIEEASLAAMDLYGSMAVDRGLVDKDSAVSGYNDLIKANEEGRLEEVLPNAKDAAKYAESEFGMPEGMKNGQG